MTAQERLYLRSIFHHFDELKPFENIPDYEKAVIATRHYKAMLKAVYHVLCLQGDPDGQTIEELKELIAEHNIKLLK